MATSRTSTASGTRYPRSFSWILVLVLLAGTGVLAATPPSLINDEGVLRDNADNLLGPQGIFDFAGTSDAIALVVTRGPAAGEITLTWTGGSPPFEVFRSANPDGVASPGNSLVQTSLRTWPDTPPQGVIFFYDVLDSVNVTVTSVSPNNGLAVASTAVLIDGTDFATGATVTIGPNVASGCTLISATRLSCTAPANGGTAARVNVTVTNPAGAGGGTATLTNGFTYTGVRNETDLPAEADFCSLQFPATMNVTVGNPSPAIFGRIYEAGLTEPPGAHPSIRAEVGMGPTTANPTTQSGWVFFPVSFNAQVGNNDEYTGTLTPPSAGTFSYTYRFSFDNGLTYTYCDLDGAGSNAGQSFDAGQLGVLDAF